MTAQTREEIAAQIIGIAPLSPVNHVAFALIVKALKEAEERGAALATPREMSWEEFQERFPRKEPTPEMRDAFAKYQETADAQIQDADLNACGLWCPNCGAHLREPKP